MTDLDTNPFWRFSLEVYARDSVAPACLALQERHDLDVNVLLFCCWAGSRGRALDADDLARLIETVRPWRDEVVRPLRAVRRWLKGQSCVPLSAARAIRERVKAEELAAEQVQQWLMDQTLPVAEGKGAAAVTARNLSAYLAALDRIPAAADVADMAAILRGCWPDLPPLEAIRLLGC